MPKIDIRLAPTRTGTGYPPPYDQPCKRRHRVSLSEAGGLTQFGAHVITAAARRMVIAAALAFP